MLQDFTKQAFDIIIQAGQSNSEGYGFGNVDAPYEPSDSVYYLNGDFTISMAIEKVAGNGIQSNFALPFAREYIQNGHLAEGRKLLILRSAVGGTGFLDHRWGLTDDLYLRMMDMIRTALELNPQNRLVALLWHQGETDADRQASYDVHYHHLLTLLQSVKDTFSTPALPFVAGDFVHDWKSKHKEMCAPVIAAIRDVCNDCGHGGFVETADLLSNLQENVEHPFGWQDDIHFSRRSIYALGKRYYACFEKIRAAEA